jgi:WD40 repeat protein
MYPVPIEKTSLQETVFCRNASSIFHKIRGDGIPFEQHPRGQFIRGCAFFPEGDNINLFTKNGLRVCETNEKGWRYDLPFHIFWEESFDQATALDFAYVGQRLVFLMRCGRDIKLCEMNTGLWSYLRNYYTVSTIPDVAHEIQVEARPLDPNICFSPDGSLFTMVSRNGHHLIVHRLNPAAPGTPSMRIQQLNPQAPLADWQENIGAFSPDNQRFGLACGAILKLFNIAEGPEGQPIRELVHDSRINTCVFSPDNATVAVGYANGQLIIWDVATGNRVCTLHNGARKINACTFSFDGLLLAAALGAGGNRVQIWDVVTRQSHESGFDDDVLACCFSPNGQQLGVTTTQGKLFVLEMDQLRYATQMRLATFILQQPQAAAPVANLPMPRIKTEYRTHYLWMDGSEWRGTFSPNGPHFISFGNGVRYQNLHNDRFDYCNEQQSPVNTTGYSCLDYTFLGERHVVIAQHHTTGSIYLADVARIYSAYFRDWLQFNDIYTRDFRRVQYVPIRFSPDGSHLLHINRGQNAIIISETGAPGIPIRRKQVINPDRPFAEWQNNLSAFSQSNQHLILACGGVVKLFDIATGLLVREFRIDPPNSRWYRLNDGEWQQIESPNRPDGEGWERQEGPHPGWERATCCAFSPDGQLIAAGFVNGQVIIWNSATGNRVRTFGALPYLRAWNLAHPENIEQFTISVCFSPNGLFLAVTNASFPYTINIYDLHTNEVRTDRLPYRPMSCVFSRDGRYLACMMEEAYRIWDLHAIQLPAQSAALALIRQLAIPPAPPVPVVAAPVPLPPPIVAAPVPAVEPATCVICTENPRQIAFTPCGHFCTCVDCAQILVNQTAPENPRCPICRAPVTGRQRVFPV